MMTLRTPAISLNSMYRGRRFLTEEGRAAKESMSLEMRLMWRRAPIEGPVKVTVTFYFKNRARRDTSNFVKALYDSATGIVWLDDSQIEEEHLYKRVDPGNPRVEIEASPL